MINGAAMGMVSQPFPVPLPLEQGLSKDGENQPGPSQSPFPLLFILVGERGGGLGIY